MIVEEVMTPDPIVVASDSPVRKVMDLLFESHVRHLPVLAGHELVGIVSDRDLRSYAAPALVTLENPDEVARRLDEPVSKLMSGDVVSVRPDTELGEVVDLMVELRIGAVPVLSAEGRLVGIVSYMDLLRAARDAL